MIRDILEKDLRRLWLPIILTTALVAALSLLDSWRYDSEAGLAETVLNIVVPLSWSLLIASAVHLEPLTSENAFWLTRPYRRPALLASKALFAILTVHVPLLLAHCAVLTSHGFSPFERHLIWTQLSVLFAVTLPSLAVASVTSTAAAFGWCALGMGAVALLLYAALGGSQYARIRTDWIESAVVLAIVAISGSAILFLQYSRRRTRAARLLAGVVAVVAVLTYWYMPRDLTAAMQCSFEPSLSRRVSVSFEARAPFEPLRYFEQQGRTAVAIPVQVSGLEPGEWVDAEQLLLRVTLPGIVAWETRRTLDIERRSFLELDPKRGFSFQHLTPDRSFVQAVRAAPVRVYGRATIRPMHGGEERLLPSTFAQTSVPTVGRCWAATQDAMFGREVLKINCESSGATRPAARVTLVDPHTGREWRQQLGEFGTLRAIPSLNWLSPLHRRQTFLQISESDVTAPGDRWTVPRSMLASSYIRIEPILPSGCANVDYSFDVADLQKWLVIPKRR